MAISQYLIGSAQPGPEHWSDYENRLLQFFRAMESQGMPIAASSHYRDPNRQAQLFAAAIKKYGSPEAARKWVSDPDGGYPHGQGASDLAYNGARLGSPGTEKAVSLAHQLAPQFGLQFRMGHEPWHIEPASASGYGGSEPAGLPSQQDITAYITQAAQARGIDPQTALTVAAGEGLYAKPSEGWQSFVKNQSGPNGREDSWGVYQLLMSHNGKPMGVGYDMFQKTGIDPRNPANWQPSIDYALDYAATNGWGSWYGAKAKGVGNWDGINGAKAIGISGGTPGTFAPDSGMPAQAFGMGPEPSPNAPQTLSLPQSGYDSLLEAYRQQLAANTPGAQKGDKQVRSAYSTESSIIRY